MTKPWSIRYTSNTFFIAILVSSLVFPALSLDARNHYDCDKYCHLNCNDIIDEGHRNECEAVHSHHSECSCHFGGAAFGLFVALGLATALILTCCVCRHCKEGSRTTNIVVVAEPQTVTTINHQGRNINHVNHSDSQQEVYKIEMKSQKQNISGSNLQKPTNNEVQPPAYSDLEDDGASSVTIITSSRMLDAYNESNLRTNQKFSSVSSERVYFENEESSNMSDSVFSPPRY